MFAAAAETSVKDLLGIKSTSEVFLNKPRSFIHVKTNTQLKASQRRLYNTLLYNAKIWIEKLSIESPDELDFILRKKMIAPIHVSLRSLIKFANLKSRSKKEIIESIKSLTKVKVEYNVLKRDKHVERIMAVRDDEIQIIDEEKNVVSYEELTEWGEDNLVISPRINFEKGEMIYHLPYKVIALLANPSLYAKIDLFASTLLSSSHAIALYEFLADDYSVRYGYAQDELLESSWIKVDSLMDIMGIEDDSFMRRRFQDFKKVALLRAIKHINENEAIEFEIVDYQVKKSGKRIDSISFYLKKRKNKKRAVLRGDKVYLVGTPSIQGELDTEKDALFKIAKLREKVESGTMDFASFKRELMRLRNVTICNCVTPEHYPEIELRTNDLGYLELYDPGQDRVIELSASEAHKFKELLYRNPEKIGDIADELEIMKRQYVGRYFIATKEGKPEQYIFKIEDVVQKNNTYVCVIEDIETGEKVDNAFENRGYTELHMLAGVLERMTFDESQLEQKRELVKYENEQLRSRVLQRKKVAVHDRYFREHEEDFLNWILAYEPQSDELRSMRYRFLLKKERDAYTESELFYEYAKSKGLIDAM